ncbi:hypothetical protein ALPO108162_11355 [Alicyclobacillus pomorum]
MKGKLTLATLATLSTVGCGVMAGGLSDRSLIAYRFQQNSALDSSRMMTSNTVNTTPLSDSRNMTESSSTTAIVNGSSPANTGSSVNIVQSGGPAVSKSSQSSTLTHETDVSRNGSPQPGHVYASRTCGGYERELLGA